MRVVLINQKRGNVLNEYNNLNYGVGKMKRILCCDLLPSGQDSSTLPTQERNSLLTSSRDKIHSFVAKLRDRCFCWFPGAMLEPIQMGSSMASLYKSLKIWVEHLISQYLKKNCL